MRPRTCTPLVLVGLLGIAWASYPVLPPSFVKPTRAVYSTRDELWFQVRVVPHESIRLLRVELWELTKVQWTETFPFEGSTEQEPFTGFVRWEPSDCIRSSDEPLAHMADRYVKPRTVYNIEWKPVPAGKYEIKASVFTNRHVKVSATRRIEVV